MCSAAFQRANHTSRELQVAMMNKGFLVRVNRYLKDHKMTVTTLFSSWDTDHVRVSISDGTLRRGLLDIGIKSGALRPR